MARLEWGPELIAQVNRRLDLLAALEEPQHKRDLMAELDVSRSTLDRAVRDLESLGLVARDDGYHLTVTGQVVLELFEGVVADLDDVAAARELLGALPRDAPMSPAMLRGARVEVADGPSPTSVLGDVLELFERADRMRAFSVALSRPDYADRIREVVAEEDTPVECVYTPALVEFARENRENFAEFVEEAPVEPYVHAELPYALRVANLPEGRAVAITVYDDDWMPRGVLLNDTIEACLWAEDVFERYREAAAPLDP
jgi:predicted transcriptional regulator